MKVRIPVFGFKHINKRRSRIRAVLDAHRIFRYTLDGENFDELVVLSRRALNLRKSSERAIRETLIPFVGHEITARTGDMIALKLAGGYELLKKGRPIAPFVGVPEPTWMPVEIAEMRYGRIRKNRTMADMTAMAMGGPAVGSEIVQSLPMRFVVTRLAADLGWPRNDRRPDHGELVRMWFMGLFSSNGRKTEIARYECVPHQRKHNKRLRRKRLEPCDRRYRYRCHVCPIGYAECWRGTHRSTWLRKACPVCGDRQAPFDPEQLGRRKCLRCETRSVREFWFREFRFSG